MRGGKGFPSNLGRGGGGGSSRGKGRGRGEGRCTGAQGGLGV
jgi:hypothetical protein